MSPDKIAHIIDELGYKFGVGNYVLYRLLDLPTKPGTEYLLKEYALGLQPIPKDLAERLFRFHTVCVTEAARICDEARTQQLTELEITTYY